MSTLETPIARTSAAVIPIRTEALTYRTARQHEVLVAVFAFNEGVKLRQTLARFPARRPYDVVVVDDGSTDGATEALPADVQRLRQEARRGIGASMQQAIAWARARGYRIIVMMAGNDKDRPDEIPRLLEPIRLGGCAIVQGSRYARGGVAGNMPAYRSIATRWVHPLIFRLAAGRRLTDTTNGFRAIRLDLFDDPRIAAAPTGMDAYEFEPWLLCRTIRLGYRVAEAPVSKIYPPHHLGYTKMPAVRGWWSILRPLLRAMVVRGG